MILINQLEEAKKLICQIEGYEIKVNEIDNKIKKVELKRNSMKHEITQGSITIVVGTFFVSGFLFCINVLSLSITALAILGSIVLAIIIEILSSNDKKEAAEEFFKSNMPVLIQGKDYYMSLATDLYYSAEFQNASALVPQDYFDSESVDYLLMVVRNRRADSLKEAINLYESYLNQKRLEELQQQQLLAAQENNRLQQEQLEYAKQQLAASNQQAEYSRQIARNTRSTARAVKLNTFITILKK